MTLLRSTVQTINLYHELKLYDKKSSVFCLFEAITLCRSTVFSGSAVLSTATVVKTLFKSRHIVYSARPSPSLCGNLKTKHHTRTASDKRHALLPKKGKSHERVHGGIVLIYCLNLGTELWPRRGAGWAHVTYEKFWKCWVDLKYKGEYIMAVGESSEETDCMTGAACHMWSFEMWKYHDFSVHGNHFYVLLETVQYINQSVIFLELLEVKY